MGFVGKTHKTNNIVFKHKKHSDAHLALHTSSPSAILVILCFVYGPKRSDEQLFSVAQSHRLTLFVSLANMQIYTDSIMIKCKMYESCFHLWNPFFLS